MGLRIKQLRKAKGWTQSELADRAKMSRSQLAMIESETRPANTLRLNAIASALDVTPEQLFDSGDHGAKLLGLMSGLSDKDKDMIVHIAESLAAKSNK